MKIKGRIVDLRHFHNTTSDISGHDVSSFVFEQAEKYGWVTACNPAARLLIGYVWRREEYPWLNVWRYILKGRVTARGLGFGTTGYHQPYADLVRTGRILDLPLYEYIDAGETVTKSYAAFLLKIPADYRGVSELSYQSGRLTLKERRTKNPRTLSLAVGNLFHD